MRNFHQIQQLAQQRKEQHQENAARAVNLYTTFQTRGTGELIPPQPIRFELPFFHEPAVMSGFALVRLPDRRFYRLPTVSSGVMRWERNKRGFYLAAFMYYVVKCELISESSAPEVPPMPIIYHHFTFSATGYKEMSSEVNDALRSTNDVPPLRPPLS